MCADYLFQQDKHYDVSYDTGDKVIQCGRHNDIFKCWLLWRSKVCLLQDLYFLSFICILPFVRLSPPGNVDRHDLHSSCILFGWKDMLLPVIIHSSFFPCSYDEHSRQIFFKTTSYFPFPDVQSVLPLLGSLLQRMVLQEEEGKRVSLLCVCSKTSGERREGDRKRCRRVKLLSINTVAFCLQLEHLPLDSSFLSSYFGLSPTFIFSSPDPVYS